MTRIRRQIPVPELYGDPELERIWCHFGPCENPASSLHTTVVCYAAPHVRNHRELPRTPQCSECRRQAYCCVQHLEFDMRSHRPGQYGKLPAGVNSRYL